MIHGSRSTYQLHACRCTPCRAANARYIADLRDRHRRGLPILGSMVNSWRMRQMLQRLVQQEGYTKPELEQALGWQGNYAKFYAARRVTLRIAVRVRKYYRVHVLDQPDDPALPFDHAVGS
jgi:hypothetical protein